MKKYLPLILLGVGVLVIGIVFVLAKKNNTAVETGDDNETVVELPADQRPSAALVPKEDGHWLKMRITNLNKVQGAASIDYELLYKVTNGTTQGVPGNIPLKGESLLERDLLLGSESSGKFRYDTGVETGTLTLRFRNDKGKLIGKVSTDFHLQNGTVTLTSVDGKFKYVLDKPASKVWFVTMQTFGAADKTNLVVEQAPYAIYSSDGLPHTGK